MPTSYRFNILPNGTFKTFRGNGKDWTEATLSDIQCVGKVVPAYYRIEIAIPWASIGLAEAPTEKKLGINLETITGDGTQQIVERIPDALPTKPATWIPLYLIAPPIDDAITPVTSHPNSTDTTYDRLGRKLENTRDFQGICIRGGKKIALK